MEPFSLSIEQRPGLAVATAAGYYDKEAGRKVNEAVSAVLMANRIYVVLDLSRCKVINSPGVASLVSLAIKVNDDFRGRLFLVGVDELKAKVFKVVGLTPLATAVPTIEAGVAEAAALLARAHPAR